jgi:hypothetical protein
LQRAPPSGLRSCRTGFPRAANAAAEQSGGQRGASPIPDGSSRQCRERGLRGCKEAGGLPPNRGVQRIHAFSVSADRRGLRPCQTGASRGLDRSGQPGSRESGPLPLPVDRSCLTSAGAKAESCCRIAPVRYAPRALYPGGWRTRMLPIARILADRISLPGALRYTQLVVAARLAEQNTSPAFVGGNGKRSRMVVRWGVAKNPILQSGICRRRSAVARAQIHQKLGRKCKVRDLKMCKSQNRRTVARRLRDIVLTRDELHNWLLFRDLNRWTG